MAMPAAPRHHLLAYYLDIIDVRLSLVILSFCIILVKELVNYELLCIIHPEIQIGSLSV